MTVVEVSGAEVAVVTVAEEVLPPVMVMETLPLHRMPPELPLASDHCIVSSAVVSSV